MAIATVVMDIHERKKESALLWNWTRLTLVYAFQNRSGLVFPGRHLSGLDRV